MISAKIQRGLDFQFLSLRHSHRVDISPRHFRAASLKVCPEAGSRAFNLAGHANSLRRDMQRLAAEFGLSPSSRTQIEAARPDDDEDIYGRYIRG